MHLAGIPIRNDDVFELAAPAAKLVGAGRPADEKRTVRCVVTFDTALTQLVGPFSSWA